MMKRILVTLLLFLAPSTAFAQAAAGTANQPIFPQTANRGVLQFLPASTPGTYLTLYTAGAKGSICKALWVDNNDTQTHQVTVQVVNATIKYGGSTVVTTAGGGSQVFAVPQNMMSTAVWPGLPLDQNGNPYFYLINGDTVQGTYATAVTASDQVDLHIVCADF